MLEEIAHVEERLAETVDDAGSPAKAGAPLILDFKNFVSRMVIVPASRSTSANFRRASSPKRIPAQQAKTSIA